MRLRRRLTGAVCAGVALLCACEKPVAPVMAPLELPVVKVIERDTPITTERVGQLYGAEDIQIRARVAGVLESINFKEGSRVRKGDLLYTIDPREQDQEVAHAEGDLASARTRLVKAETDVTRYRPLAEMKAVSQADLDAAVAEEGAARGQVAAAEASVRFSRLNLGYTRITAPIDGLIGMTQAKVGDYVGQYPNPVVLNTVSNTETMQARFSITERDYLDLARRFGTASDEAPQPRQIELLLADGSVYPQKGKIDFADRQVDASTGTLRLQASFPNPDKVLRPGQYARVRVVIEMKKGALLVPQRAVQELQGQMMASVVGPDDTVETRALKLGARIGSLVVVDAGLKAGDRVILEGAQKVQPGAKIVPKEVALPDEAPAGGTTPEPAPPAA